VACRSCGGLARESLASGWSSYDPASRTFEHRKCRQIVVVCPDCGLERRHSPRAAVAWDPREPEEAREARLRPDGRLLRRCRACRLRRSRRLIAKARHVNGEGLARDRLSRILNGTAPATPGEQALFEWFKTHATPLDRSWAIADAARDGDREAARALQRLQLELMLRKGGRKAIARARGEPDPVRRAQALGALGVPAAGSGDSELLQLRAGERARSGFLQEARRRGHRRAPVKAPETVVLQAGLTGTFSLCPLCGLLLYRTRAQEARGGRSGRQWHPPCRRAWEEAPGVRARLAGWRRIAPALRPGYPLPPPPPSLSGRPPDPEVLAASYRSLLAHAAGASYPELAARELEAGADQAAVRRRAEAIRKRIDTMRARLPASWGLVFGRGAGSAARQRLYALPQRLRPHLDERKPLARHLQAQGIPTQTIEAVVGASPG
jgi:hypothetical protein